MSEKIAGWLIVGLGGVCIALGLAAVWTGGGTVSAHLGQTAMVLGFGAFTTGMLAWAFWVEL